MIKLCLIPQPLNTIGADKTKFPVGFDPIGDCGSHAKASPQTQTLESTNILPPTLVECHIFSYRWYKTGKVDPNIPKIILLLWLGGTTW